jgi:hypothetical protein
MTSISPIQYRAQLEKERDEIMSALEHPEQYSRRQLVNELRHIVDELQAMDEARSWINMQETQPRIQLDLTQKVLRQS